MSGAARVWPPLIMASKAPRWVKRRDFLLTLVMWAIFGIMLETEFELFFGNQLARFGWSDFGRDANWDVFFVRLSPFLMIAFTLIALLVVASIITSWRRRQTLSLPAPAVFAIDDQARRAGIDAPSLEQARLQQIVVVHLDGAGKMRLSTEAERVKLSPTSV